MDMVWPEIRNRVEKITFEHGLVLPPSCGIDPQSAQIRIDDGRFGVSTDLDLQHLHLATCIDDVRRALPNPSEAFNDDTNSTASPTSR